MGRPLPHRNRRPRDQPLESQCRNPTCSDGGQHTVCPTLMNAAESMLLLRRSRDRCQPQLAQNHIEPLPQTAMIAVGRQPICDRDQMTFVARIPAPRDAALVVQRFAVNLRRAAPSGSTACSAAQSRRSSHNPYLIWKPLSHRPYRQHALLLDFENAPVKNLFDVGANRVRPSG